MTRDTDTVLAAIDDALSDTIDGAVGDDVSPDAMRWVPDQHRDEESRPVIDGSVSVAPLGHGWRDIGWISDSDIVDVVDTAAFDPVDDVDPVRPYPTRSMSFTVPLTDDQADVLHRLFRDLFGDVVDAYRRAWRDLTRHVSAAFNTTRGDYTLHPPPTSARQHALEARRSRNTGPPLPRLDRRETHGPAHRPASRGRAATRAVRRLRRRGFRP